MRAGSGVIKNMIEPFQRRRMRELRRLGLTYSQIAQRFGVSESAVSYALRRTK
jgi:DNA-directed RNA polymerase specialized sigma24 family protein